MSILGNSIIDATSTKHDGNMSLRFSSQETGSDNLRLFLAKYGLDNPRGVIMKCNHGEKIVLVDQEHLIAKDDWLYYQPAEVLVTGEINLALLLLTADCLPISFYDPVTKTIALAHLSRQTTILKLAQKTVRFLVEKRGVKAADLKVSVGPYIYAKSYCFPLPLAEKNPILTPFITETDGVGRVDLRAANETALKEVGVKSERIEWSPIDTATSPDHFSHYPAVREIRVTPRADWLLFYCERNSF